MSPSDIVIATLFYQFSIYVCVRLARRGFTLGELAVVCNAATALLMETVNMTRMNVSRHGIRCAVCAKVTGVDPNPTYTLHQDLPTSDATPDFSTRVDPWLSPRRLSPLPSLVPLPASRSETCPPTPLPARETDTSSTPRLGLLCRRGPCVWRSRWDVDQVVSRLAGPICLGRAMAS
jgi:hypothetical protein